MNLEKFDFGAFYDLLHRYSLTDKKIEDMDKLQISTLVRIVSGFLKPRCGHCPAYRIESRKCGIDGHDVPEPMWHCTYDYECLPF